MCWAKGKHDGFKAHAAPLPQGQHGGRRYALLLSLCEVTAKARKHPEVDRSPASDFREEQTHLKQSCADVLGGSIGLRGRRAAPASACAASRCCSRSARGRCGAGSEGSHEALQERRAISTETEKKDGPAGGRRPSAQARGSTKNRCATYRNRKPRSRRMLRIFTEFFSSHTSRRMERKAARSCCQNLSHFSMASPRASTSLFSRRNRPQGTNRPSPRCRECCSPRASEQTRMRRRRPCHQRRRKRRRRRDRSPWAQEEGGPAIKRR